MIKVFRFIKKGETKIIGEIGADDKKKNLSLLDRAEEELCDRRLNDTPYFDQMCECATKKTHVR